MKLPMLLLALAAAPPTDGVVEGVEQIYAEVEALYIDLHQNPELSGREKQTAAKLARPLRQAGFAVSTGVGGHGVVGLLKNGAGPTVMLRTELDGLPIEEKTGLPYASRATSVDGGKSVPTMHACGHDAHMASLVGAARLLAAQKDRWRGTLMIVGQPAEEDYTGANAMLADGLFTRFPKPDYAFAVHVFGRLPAGQVGYRAGVFHASADMLEVTVFGKGGNGSTPQGTIDPIVIASRAVLGLQTIVSRESDPLDPVVITVGSFHAGSKANIIPDEAKLEISMRAVRPETRQRVLAAIERTFRGEAIAAGAPREPEVKKISATDPVVNHPELADRLVAALRRTVGEANVLELPPTMGSEDFSAYGAAGVKTFKLYTGAIEPKVWAAAQASGVLPPASHSPLFAPDRVPTLKTTTAVFTASALQFLARP